MKTEQPPSLIGFGEPGEQTELREKNHLPKQVKRFPDKKLVTSCSLRRSPAKAG